MAQPDTNLCWATAAAIIASWRDQVVHPVADSAHQLGSPYAELFDTNAALAGRDQPAFARALGWRTEPPASYPLATLLRLLQQHGTLWVATGVSTVHPFSTHARILTSIVGDGTNEGTDLTLLDPERRTATTQSYADFLSLFEAMAIEEGSVGANRFVEQIMQL